MIMFGDSGPYPQDIPFKHAALYSSDCDYPCPPEVAGKWAPADRRWITFTGDPDCSIADFEPGTEVFHEPFRLRRWARNRELNNRGLSIVYSSLSNVKAAQAALGKVPRVWWLATLDGQQKTQDELSHYLGAVYGVHIGRDAIWAQQWEEGDRFDTSNRFGDWR